MQILQLYKHIADFVFTKTGISYPEKDFYRLESRVNKLLTKFSCATEEDLYKKLSGPRDPALETYLLDICTNNETYFFRDNKPFDTLSKEIFPELLNSFPAEKLKIWSNACSTGQEPLSIIMTLIENPAYLNKFSIDATDISTFALDKCNSKTYSGLDVQRGLPVVKLMKHFDSVEGDNWKFKEQFSPYVNYQSFNILTGNYTPAKYHVIFCRNILIYQNKENKSAILENLEKSLKSGGFLIMGSGESLIGTNSKLKQAALTSSLVYQKEK